MYKRDVINFLFLISFPMFGIGTYVSAIHSPSVGYILSVSPHLLIMLVYFLDLVYSGEFNIRLNSNYYLMLIFLLGTIASFFIALAKGLPDATFIMTAAKAVLLIVPFHAFVIVFLYNERKGSFLQLTLLSLSLLLIINLAGFFVMGLSNALHSIDGRLNFPFLDGFYSGASLLAIINLMLLFNLKRSWGDPLRFTFFAAYFSFNLVLFFLINSRLTIMLFMLVLALSLIGLIRMRGLYIVSMFTIPILLSSGLLIYKVLQWPVFISMLKRVDIRDVTTFNGRAFLWRDAMDWLLYDQLGLLWGNGHKGHYFINLASNVAKLWNEKNLHHMHLHSTSMEILVSQGVILFLVFAFLFYKIYKHYKSTHQLGKEEGSFLPVVIFLLFLMQVDNFLYMDGLGFVIFSLLVARVAITSEVKKKQESRYHSQSNVLFFNQESQRLRAA